MVKMDYHSFEAKKIFIHDLLRVNIISQIPKKLSTSVFFLENHFKIWKKQKSLAQGGERTSRLSQVPTGEYDYSPGRLNSIPKDVLSLVRSNFVNFLNLHKISCIL